MKKTFLIVVALCLTFAMSVMASAMPTTNTLIEKPTTHGATALTPATTTSTFTANLSPTTGLHVFRHEAAPGPVLFDSPYDAGAYRARPTKLVMNYTNDEKFSTQRVHRQPVFHRKS